VLTVNGGGQYIKTKKKREMIKTENSHNLENKKNVKEGGIHASGACGITCRCGKRRSMGVVWYRTADERNDANQKRKQNKTSILLIDQQGIYVHAAMSYRQIMTLTFMHS
jgi:hypothetical protein